MLLTFLGTGTCIPTRERAPSGALLSIGAQNLLFDSGSGTIGRLVALGLDPTELDLLYYTHEHSDHTADLIPLLQAMQAVGRHRALHLTAPTAFFRFLDGLLELQPWAQPCTFEIVRHCAEYVPFAGPATAITAAPTHNTPSSVGYRLQAEGSVLVLSGDATFCPELIELSRGADLLVLECSYPDGYVESDHLTASQAAQVAAEAGVRHLVLTHFYPPCKDPEIRAQVARVYKGRLTLAYDGLVLSI